MGRGGSEEEEEEEGAGSTMPGSLGRGDCRAAAAVGVDVVVMVL